MPVTEKKEAKSIDEIAQQFGIDPIKLKSRMKDFSRLKSQEGLVVDLDIGKWDGKARLEQDDLGIQISQEEERYVSLGHQKLFPPEFVNAVARAESHGRSNLERNSFRSEWGYFVPVTAWEEWKNANEAARKEFFDARDAMISKFDEILQQVEKDFQERAEAVWDRMDPKPGDKRSWVVSFARRLVGKVPPKEEIARRFYWSEKFTRLRMPSEIEADLVKQEKLRAERVDLHHESEDRKRKIEAMNDDLVAKMREEKEKAQKEQNEFVWQAMKAQREAISACLAQALTAIARNDGKMTGSTVKSLRSMVDRAKSLNFFDDPEVNESIGKLDHFLNKDARLRSTSLFRRQATEIKAMMESSVRKLEDEATRQEEVCRLVGSDLMGSVRTVE